jgi:hypothetical protein
MISGRSEQLGDWLLPSGMRKWLRRRTIRRRFRTRVTPEDRKTLAFNAALRDRHRGRRCFVLGNGPSLGDVDLTLLRSEITIGMNSIQLHSSAGNWSPKYYCRAEPGNVYESVDRLKSIRALTERLDCEGYFFPLDARNAIEQLKLLPAPRTHYFKSIVDLTEWPVNEFAIDLTDGIPFVGNTAQFAILLALYLGANPIILMGMDHDFLAHRSINRHFYAPQASEVGGSDDLRIYSYKKMMTDCVREWERYEVISQIARRNGIDILNATSGSFLDVYPCIKLSELDILTQNAIPNRTPVRKCKAGTTALIAQ